MPYTGTYISSPEIGAGQDLTARLQLLQDKFVEGFDKVLIALQELRGTASQPEPHTATLADVVDALTTSGGADCTDPCGVMMCVYSTLQSIETLLSSGLVVDSTIQVDNSQVVARLIDIYDRLFQTNNWLNNLHILAGPSASPGTIRADLAALAANTSGLATEATLNAVRGYLSNIHLLMGPAGQAGTVRGDIELVRANIAAGNTSMHSYLVHDARGTAELLTEMLAQLALSHVVYSNFQKILSFDAMPASVDGSILGQLGTGGDIWTKLDSLIGALGTTTQAPLSSMLLDMRGDLGTTGPLWTKLDSLIGALGTTTQAPLSSMLLDIRTAIENLDPCCYGDTPLLREDPGPDPPAQPSDKCARAAWALAVITSRLSTIQSYQQVGDYTRMHPDFTIATLTAIVNSAPPGLGLTMDELSALYFTLVNAASGSSPWLTGMTSSWSQIADVVRCTIYTASGPGMAHVNADTAIDSGNQTYDWIYKQLLSPKLLNLVFSDTFAYDVSGFSGADCSGCGGGDCADVVTLTSTAPWYWFQTEWGWNVSTIEWDQTGSDPRLYDSATNTLPGVWSTWIVNTNFDSENEAKTVITPARRKYRAKALYGEPAVHVYLHRADGSYLDVNISIGDDWHEIPWDNTEYVSIVCSVLYDPNNANQQEFRIVWCFDPV